MVHIDFVDSDGKPRAVQSRGGLTLMEVALQHGVEGIDGECGGACSCATCHVHIEDDWLDTVGVARGDEADLLSDVEERRANSRLACQIKISDALDGIRVKVPARAVV